MPTLTADTSALLLIDFQTRLMPAIEDGAVAIANAHRLLTCATLLNVPSLATEQYAKRLGSTVDTLAATLAPTFHKMTFDAGKTAGFFDALPARETLIVAGCEAHVCVLQTVLGLLEAGRTVRVVQDAVGSRKLENKLAALNRMERHSAEIVTTEMVIFEWLQTAEHPKFKEIVALIK